MVKVCRDSIIQFERSSDTSRVRDARLSGISAKRFEDKLKERKEGATLCILRSGKDVMALSVRDRYTSLCHFACGNTFAVAISDREGVVAYSAPLELPEPDLFAL